MDMLEEFNHFYADIMTDDWLNPKSAFHITWVACIMLFIGMEKTGKIYREEENSRV